MLAKHLPGLSPLMGMRPLFQYLIIGIKVFVVINNL
jgi:hypothetical protein